MPRVKGGPKTRRRHKKVLKLTKGHRGTRSTLYRRAHESMLKALSYAYRHRRERKREMRKLWIIRINAMAREHGLSYSKFIHGLKLLGVELNRKALANLALEDPDAFKELVLKVKEKLEACAQS